MTLRQTRTKWIPRQTKPDKPQVWGRQLILRNLKKSGYISTKVQDPISNFISHFADTPANDAAKTEATNGVAEKEEVREPEEITYTLDEWKAQQGEKKELKFNTRKAGEGDDLDPKWKKTYAYKKEKESHEDDDEEVRS